MATYHITHKCSHHVERATEAVVKERIGGSLIDVFGVSNEAQQSRSIRRTELGKFLCQALLIAPGIQDETITIEIAAGYSQRHQFKIILKAALSGLKKITKNVRHGHE